MKRVLISLALLLACGAGMASDHTENRQFIHDQLQMDRQRFRALQTPEFLQRQWSAGAENQAFLDAQASQLR